jgi:hypothetical protein
MEVDFSTHLCLHDAADGGFSSASRGLGKRPVSPLQARGQAAVEAALHEELGRSEERSCHFNELGGPVGIFLRRRFR